MSIGTLLQFARAARDAYVAENPGLTKAEYDRNYPPESRLNEWIDAIWAAAGRGEVIPATVLDDLWRRTWGVAIAIWRRHPTAFPLGYVFPNVRQKNRERHREFVEGRRRGKANAEPKP